MQKSTMQNTISRNLSDKPETGCEETYHMALNDIIFFTKIQQNKQFQTFDANLQRTERTGAAIEMDLSKVLIMSSFIKAIYYPREVILSRRNVIRFQNFTLYN